MIEVHLPASTGGGEEDERGAGLRAGCLRPAFSAALGQGWRLGFVSGRIEVKDGRKGGWIGRGSQ